MDKKNSYPAGSNDSPHLRPSNSRGMYGITLTAKDNAHVVARTIEWGGSELNSQYVIVPRGYSQQSLTPGAVCPAWSSPHAMAT
mgnify:CR=1 FL=1